ncbi:MAG: L,D-transpeptidase [Bacillota bacterium]
MAMAVLLFSGKIYIFKENTEKKYTYMLPYEVIEERPVYIPDRDYAIRTIEIDGVISREKVVNELMAAVKKLYQEESRSPKKILAVQKTGKGQREVGMAVWPGENSNIKVYVYPRDDSYSVTNTGDMRRKYLLWETTTVIRSALYQFVKKNGYMPGDLSVLTQPFPTNYLTAIPREPYTMSNSVCSSYNGGGGWVYSARDAALLEESVKQSLKPNLPVETDIPFDPLYVFIDKTNNLLSVVSGDKTIKSYRVALGKGGRTPEGDLHIARKIMNPNKGVSDPRNTYGSRLMELSQRDFAIHGTNIPGSIGRNETSGCVRLYNPDMEELYSIVPLYSPVKISKNRPGFIKYPVEDGGLVQAGIMKSGTPLKQGPLQGPEGLYDKTESPREESGIVCKWSG